MGNVLYVFSGIGTQWAGMSAAVRAHEAQFPGFSLALETADQAFRRIAGWSILAILDDPAFDGQRHPAESHAAIFTLQYALTQALAKHRRTPSAVLGHSGGEVAAAVAAGVLSLDEAVLLVSAHGDLMKTTASGAMLHVELAPANLAPHLEALGDRIELAVHNSDGAIVVAGDECAIAELTNSLEQAHVTARRLRITVPFHTRAVEPALAQFRQRLADLKPRPPQIPIYSAWRGGLALTGDFDADYWVRHVREPVGFCAAVHMALADGHRTFVEISPHPVLLQHIATIGRTEQPVCIATLHRDLGAEPLREWLGETHTSSSASPETPDSGVNHLDLLRAILTELLPGTSFPADWPTLTWSELGLKSVQLVALGKRLTERLGIALPATLAYRCPTPNMLAVHLVRTGTTPTPPPVACATTNATEQSANAKVAIVGLACRFPGGANTPEQYWSLLTSGRDPICEIPADRWPAMDYYAPTVMPGKSVSRWAGFLADCDLQGFDDKLFRLSPREASALDPQQRLLLEVTWEALENAGIPPLSLKGKRVAVYLGLSTDDYKTASFYTPDLAAIDPYAGAGALGCTAGGRLSYFFGWQGPNVTIDTACSSSLVALHQARQALLAGECDLAVVAGVNVMLTPHLFVYFSQVGALSPTGRCHTFDASADGYVRAEGCGVLVLEREADALKNRRRPRARVAGSAVNQDGASTGFSAPNGAAQTDVIAAAWRAAGAHADEIAYVEAHGTGTPIGDPIELESLAAAAPGRTPADPLLVGSVKSHIGHLEAAAGVAGVIKLVLALEHGELPGNFQFKQPNPRLDWANLPLKVVDRVTPFPARGARRLAGISSFGFSGTNAHAVLEGVEAPPTAVPSAPTFVMQLSAHNDTALKALAHTTASALKNHHSPADFVWSSNTGRQPFPQRLGMAARSPQDLVAGLAAWAAGQPVPPTTRLATGQGDAPPLVFAYTGQGCQSPGMAQQLYETEPVFRAVVDRCDARFAELRGRSLKHFLIDPASSAEEFEATELAQPAIFIVQAALTELLASWGIRPERIVGHSAGEVAAGVAAGVLTLEEGISLIEARSRLMGAHPPGGGMVSVPVDEATARTAIATAAPDEVFVAGINTPETIVLSGATAALDRVLAALGAAGRQARRLRISNAFHTPMLAPVADGLVAHCREHLPGIGDGKHRGHIEWLSSVDGRNLGAGGTPPEYWAEQLLAPVRFHTTLSRLEEQPGSYVEIGPAAVLTALGSERPASQDGRAAWIATQQRQMDGALTLAGAVAAIAARGHRIDWNALAGGPRRRTDLPPYPFQRRRHWRAPILPASGGQAVSQTPAQPQTTVPPAPTFHISPQPQVPAMTSASPPAVDSVRALIAEITGFPLADIVPDVPLLDLGLDSLMLVQLKGHLEARHGVSVKLAEFYDQLDTAEKVAARLPATPAAPIAAPVAPAAASVPAAAPCAMPQPAAHFAAPAALAKPGAGVEGLMAMQLEALSRLMSEQLAVLGQAPAALPAQAPAVAPKAEPPAQMPNFRSLKLDADVLTPAQQAFVADLTQRYVAKTGGSRRLAAEHRGPLADWKNTLSYRHTLKEMTYPIAAVRSKGAYFTDVDGNEFLDITMGCGIVILGHAPDAVVAAVQEQAAAHYAIGPQTPLAADVAEIFCRMVGMERVTFCNTGAEAVMMAVRIARAVTGRRKIALFAGAYHGTWDGVLGVEHDGHTWPIAAGIPPGMVEDLVILNYGTDEALAAIRAQAHEFAAVLVEPVQSRRPSLQPAAFLRELRTITENAGCALIFDEMINGFRIGPGGAQAHFGVRADLATYGKIAGGGLPMSAVAGSARFLDSVDGGPWNYGDDSHPDGDVVYFGGTYVKHPLALAAAKTALSELERLGEAGYAELNARSQRFADTLNAWFAEEQVPMQVAHFGSQFRFDGSGKYSAMMQPIELDLFFFLLILKGIYVWERRVLFLSFAHGEAEIERIVATVKEAVQELRAGGFEFRTAGGATPGKSEGKRDAAAGPASFAQRRLYALTQLEGRNTVYNVPLALDIAGRLDATRLEDCFRKILARHEALRTRFGIENAHEDDGLTQRVVPLTEIEFAVERRDCPAAGFTAAAEAFIRPFDLDRAPLFRVLLLSDGADRHALVMDAHHIVVDGLALNILARELMALYEGPITGNELPPLTVRPLDAVATQAAYLDSAACDEDAAWWRARYASLPPLLELPLDNPRPPRRSHRGGDCLAIIDKQATAALKAAAKSKRLTLFSLALGVFGGFLHRLTGQDDIVVGLPVGGRDDPRYADLIGMFANTLPLRLNASGNQPLGEHARAAQKEFLVALEHQAYPLEALIAGLKLPRDLARNPLFDTMFIFEDGNDRVYRMAGLECKPLPASRHAAMFDLAMEVIEAEGELQLRLEYDADLFEPASAARLLDIYRRLLVQAPASLDVPLSELDCVPVEERAQLLAWGDGGASPEPRATILELFDRQVNERPDAPALVAEDGALSYRELDCAANRLAHSLRHRLTSADFSASPRIALVAERRAELLVGLLAILRAGAAYVPVDPDFPADRVALMLEDSGCIAVLASRSLVGELSTPAGVPVIGLDEVDASLPDTAPEVSIDPDSLAYLIYTSGSTGKPKGTRLFHRNAASFFAALPQAFGFALGQRLLAITTVSFDIAGLELLGALACGMTVVLASAATARDPARIVERIGSERIEVLQSTPTRLKLLVEQAGIASLAALRTILVGGEALPQDLADQLASLPDTAVFNVYGPTETTIWSAACRVAPGPVSLGRALPGEKLFVLSSHQRLQPIGAVGELAIAGDGVGGAYHNRPELSAERFPSIPELCDGPVYLTGDLARWLPDGRLEFLGRSDGQIKIRGMRIEPAEIEQWLRRYQGVRDAVVVAVKNAQGFADLVAYLAADQAPDVAACRAFLAKELPEPCLPSVFVTLPELPQTPNGKIDRRALPKPDITVPSAPSSAREPANPREQAILSAFAAVLTNPIGPEDDYFAHGGDSIRALRFIARLREMGYALELEALFRHPTAAALAPCLADHEEAARSQATNDSAPTFTGLDGDELDELFA
jgi:amino acid adenylation domain-containing protein